MGLLDPIRNYVRDAAKDALDTALEEKFSPADANVNWPHVQTLVHGPGAPGWEKTGQGDFNSAVFACLMAIATSYPEAPLRVYLKVDDKDEPLPDAPLQKLLDKPTPGGELSLEDIFFWIAWCKHTDGNAYLLKVRAGDATRGNVIELWPVSPADISPVTERGRDGKALAWISHYRMRVGPNKYDDVPLENIVHFRLGIDPLDRRLGLSPLKRLVREVSADDEATKFTDALLKNFAIPGIIVTPGSTAIIKDPDRISEQIQQKFGGDNRGKIAVLTQESDIKQFGFSPEQLTLDRLHRIPEERIAAVMGVPAIVAGLGAGLENATYSNARELREMYTETKLVPQWRQDAARLNVSLKPDFSSDPKVFVAFDLSDVRALQEDMDAKYKRLSTALANAPFVLRNEARAETGFEPIKGWDEEDTDTAPAPTPPAFLQPDDDEDEEDDGESMSFSLHSNGHKGRLTAAEQKQMRRAIIQARRRIRSSVTAVAEDEVRRFFRGLSDAIIAAAAREDDEITAAGNGFTPVPPAPVATKKLTRAEWRQIVARIFQQEVPAMEGIFRRTYLSIVAGSWELLNIELGESVQFSQNDPLVQDILAQAGTRIRGIRKTTLDALQPLLAELYVEGQPPQAIAQAVRSLVEETYSGRARAIARTEVGTAQQQATSARYRKAGVKHVEVLDDGFDNSHPFCRKVNGKIVTIEWAERNPLQHPNCVRAFAAVFNHDGPVFAEEVPWGG